MQKITRLLWAKSDRGDQRAHSLWCHLLDAAAVCEALLPRFGTVTEVPNAWLAYLVGLHDIGKADRYFQNKDADGASALRKAGLELPESLDGFRHEARSADWLLPHLRACHMWGRRAAVVVSGAIHGHHGSFDCECISEDEMDPVQAAEWSRFREELAEALASVLGIEHGSFQPDAFTNDSAVGVHLAGLTVLSDWISSNGDLYHYHTLDTSLPPAGYMAAAREEADRAVRRLALDTEVARAPETPLFRDVWPQLDSLRPAQAALEEACRAGVAPGLAIIEAPMGEGKTEAAIYLAECWNRLAGREGAYIALPTQATSNQMHERYRDYLHDSHPKMPEPRLVHGMAWLLDDVAPEHAPQTWAEDSEAESLSLEWFQSQKRALLAPHAVGTVDQSLMAALLVKHGFLRLLGLSTKVLIIDEVHAYDEFMTVLMERLLEWCRVLRIPVILLSATLSHRQKQRLTVAYSGRDILLEESASYPLLTFVPRQGAPRTIPVPPDPARDRTIRVVAHEGLLGNAEAVAKLALSLVENGGCACVLANTVNSAQEVFKALQGRLPDDELFLFHARFTADRREEIEREITDRFGKQAGNGSKPPRPQRAIVVGTQVLEQSLDLDWDVLISEIAPIDLLLQRVGRLWRHEGTPRQGHARPVLHILLPPEGSIVFGSTEIKWAGSRGVYHRAPLLRTLELLHGRETIQLPRDFRPLIEGCYGGSVPPSHLVPPHELEAAMNAWEKDTDAAGDEAHTHLIPAPDPDGFTLADAPSSPVGEHEEGNPQSYFRARTRRGDDTRTVLVLEDAELIALCHREDRPPLYRLKQLFRRKAALPAWWLPKDLTPADGYEAPFEGAKWLRGAVVLPMRAGEWRGTESTRNFTIENKEDLGLTRSQQASNTTSAGGKSE
jgi:CRISPR-associated endonuclease/helicase Cas3